MTAFCSFESCNLTQSHIYQAMINSNSLPHYVAANSIGRSLAYCLLHDTEYSNETKVIAFQPLPRGKPNLLLLLLLSFFFFSSSSVLLPV